MRSAMRAGVLLLAAGMGTLAAVAQQPATTPKEFPQTSTMVDENLQSAEAVVRTLYNLVSVKPEGPKTDWDKVRALFHKDAVIVLRTAPRETQVFSVQGFIDDFIAFNERARVGERGFSEKILRLKPMAFQDIAHILVLYEASIPGSPRAPQQGIDSFQLINKDGRWRIISVVNDVPLPGSTLPEELER